MGLLQESLLLQANVNDGVMACLIVLGLESQIAIGENPIECLREGLSPLMKRCRLG